MLGIAIIILVWEFVYGQPLDEREIEKQFEGHFENAISNITGMPFDLHTNYSKEYSDLITKKLIINYCENNPNFTGCTLLNDKIKPNESNYCHDHFGNGSSICHELPGMILNMSNTLMS